mgnify:CR=1 FL=1
MEHEFWHQKWKSKQIGFHLSEANPHLVKHFTRLHLRTGQRIFLPLCGKTKDIGWLLAKGCEVSGCELSELAVKELFAELELTPDVKQIGNIKLYSADKLNLFVGDFFDLTAENLGPVDAVYDRAALVALPAEIRSDYTAHLRDVTKNAQQLLVCYQYDQSLMSGPPFSILNDEVKQHYQAYYDLTLLSQMKVEDGLRPHCPAEEAVWLLVNCSRT